MADDRYNLQRFHKAQAFMYDDALMEIYSGRKQSQWMWFVYPQIKGLGKSDATQDFEILSIEEARAFTRDEELWQNYLEITAVLLEHKGVLPQLIFGKNDSMKLKSSLTLFNFVAPKEKIIKDALHFFFADQLDQRTLKAIKELKNKK